MSATAEGAAGRFKPAEKVRRRSDGYGPCTVYVLSSGGSEGWTTARCDVLGVGIGMPTEAWEHDPNEAAR